MNVLKKLINHHYNKEVDEMIGNNNQNPDKIDLIERKNSNTFIVVKENIDKNIPHVVNIPKSLSLEINPHGKQIYYELLEGNLNTCDKKVTKLKKD
jgi:hypothetical protein